MKKIVACLFIALMFIGAVTEARASAPQMFGVNMPSGAFNTNALPGTYGTNYIYPGDADFAYYQGKGLTFIRVAFLWERVQHTLNATLDATEMGRLDAVVACAHNRGMKVLLDMHDYGEYTFPGVGTYLIGTTQVPLTAYQNVWGQLAAHYANETAIYGYDIMNEPQNSLANWQSQAQAAVNTIRQNDTTHYVFIEGVGYSQASAWAYNNSTLSVTDSANLLVYSAHSYWNANGDGNYGLNEQGTTSSGVNSVQPFVSWIVSHGYNGHVGEYGVPKTNNNYLASWETALDGFLAYLRNYNISGNYYSGGPWVNDQINCEPTNNFTTDSLQMAVLQNYNNSGSTFVTGQTMGTLRNDFTGSVGYQFTVGSSAITVSQLGRWVVAGNSGSHTVSLVRASDNTVLGSVSVATSGAMAGAFKYAPLSGSVTLAANTAYFILSSETSGGDQWYTDNTTLTTTGLATVNTSVWYSGSYHTNTSGHAYGPLSFVVVPGPTASFVTGQVLGTLRNDFAGSVGYQFTVGGSPITVTQLGRWVVAGNSGAHTVSLVRASDQTVLGSVSVTTSGAPAGAFKYTALSGSGVTLAANTAYYILSSETSGGDQWYTDDTTITTGSAATVNTSVWYSSSYGYYTNTSGHAYGPLSFIVGGAFVTGQTLGTLRNDFTGWVGYQFTVGSTPITVTQLGRWVVAGNSGAHTVSLVRASDNATLGSVSVATSGAPAGAFKYTALSGSGVTLAAGAAYYIVGAETNGGDQWYHDDTTVTTGAAATVNMSLWYDTSYHSSTIGAHAFGPFNFISQ